MYWAVREDGTYEVIDGQQRTISIRSVREKAIIPYRRTGISLICRTMSKSGSLVMSCRCYVCEGSSQRESWLGSGLSTSQAKG